MFTFTRNHALNTTVHFLDPPLFTCRRETQHKESFTGQGRGGGRRRGEEEGGEEGGGGGEEEGRRRGEEEGGGGGGRRRGEEEGRRRRGEEEGGGGGGGRRRGEEEGRRRGEEEGGGGGGKEEGGGGGGEGELGFSRHMFMKEARISRAHPSARLEEFAEAVVHALVWIGLHLVPTPRPPAKCDGCAVCGAP